VCSSPHPTRFSLASALRFVPFTGALHPPRYRTHAQQGGHAYGTLRELVEHHQAARNGFQATLTRYASAPRP